MTIKEAKEIIEAYKVSLAKGTEGGTVLRKKSLLSHSKGKIKHAYLTLVEDLIGANALMLGLRQDLTETYTQINTFVEDAIVEKYANIYSEWQAKKFDPNKSKRDESAIKQYLAFTHTLGATDLFNELNDYIEELQAR